MGNDDYGYYEEMVTEMKGDGCGSYEQENTEKDGHCFYEETEMKKDG